LQSKGYWSFGLTGDLDVGGSDGDANMYSHCPWEVNQGLGKYEAAFRVNDIDQTVLPNLTAPRSGRRDFETTTKGS